MNALLPQPQPDVHPLMSFFEKAQTEWDHTVNPHLEELRNRIVVCVAAILIGMLLAFYYALPVINLLKHMAPFSVHFVQLSPGEVLMTSTKLSLVLGIALASPILLYQLIRFVLPGLEPREKGLLAWITFGGLALFAIGVVFAYFAVMPSALLFLFDYGQEVATSQVGIAAYTDFCMGVLLMSGVLFELPLLMLFLSFSGLVTSKLLMDQWRMAVVVIMVAAAILTPSQDAFTMIIVGLTMALLYFASVIPIKLLGR